MMSYLLLLGIYLIILLDALLVSVILAQAIIISPVLTFDYLTTSVQPPNRLPSRYQMVRK